MSGIFSLSHRKDKKAGILLNDDFSHGKAKELTRQPAVVVHDLKNALTVLMLRMGRLGADPGSVYVKDILNDMEQIACQMSTALERLAVIIASQSHPAANSPQTRQRQKRNGALNRKAIPG
jgi:hypothetical protein